MSIFGDIADAAKAAAGEVGDEAISVTKALTAGAVVPAGLVWDIAKSPGDWKSDLADAPKDFVGRIADPLINTDTVSGKIASPIMDGIEHVYREEIAEPTSAAGILIDKAWQDGDLSELFDDKAWDDAMAVAQHQSPGQSWSVMAHNHQATARSIPVVGGWLGFLGGGDDPDIDPMGKHPYKQLNAQHPFMSSMISGTADAAIRWYADPGLIAGRAAGLARRAVIARPITESEKAQGAVLDLMANNNRLRSRTEALYGHVDNGTFHPGYVDGKSAGEIWRTLPEYQEVPNGIQLAHIVAETNKIENVAERINRRRFIQAVVNGDTEAIAKGEGVRDYLDDALRNLDQGAVVGAKSRVAVDDVFSQYTRRGLNPPALPREADPKALLEAQRQVNNQPELKTFLENERNWFSDLLGTGGEGGAPGFADTMSTIPRVTAASKRELGRMNNQGLMRSGTPNTGHEKINSFLNATGGTRRLESFYQATPTSMPVRVVHGLLVKQAKLPVTLFDSYRNLRPQGIVNVADPDEAYRQLDAYLRKSNAPAAARADLQAKMAAAKTTFARAQVLSKAEDHAQDWVFAKHGLTDVDGDLKREMLRSGQAKRWAMFQSREGRAYSAATDEGGTRIDYIDEDGFPVAMPVLETQDASLFPMMDVNILDQVVKRHKNVLRAMSRTMQDEKHLLDPSISGLMKRRTGEVTSIAERTYGSVTDALMPVLDQLNRMWKFSVLFRAGYPMRVLADDHIRAFAAFGSSVTTNAIKDGTYNALHNLTVAKGLSRKRLVDLQGEHSDILGRIGTDEFQAQNAAAYRRIREIDKKLNRGTNKPGIPDGAEVRLGERSGEYEGEVAHAHVLEVSVPGESEPIAHILWDKTTGEVHNIEVKPAYRRQGIATDLFNRARSASRKNGFVVPRHSEYLSDDGRAFVASKPESRGILSTRRRAELQAEREGLLNQHPEDFKDLIARRREIEDEIATGAYKVDKRRMGGAGDDTMDAFGVQVPTAFGGTHGEQVRDFNANALMYDNLGSNTEAGINRVLGRGGIPQIVQPTDPGHLESWAHAINYQLAPSELARKIIEGETADDLVQFLRNTPRGKELRRLFPFHGGNPERWADNVERMVDQYLPTQELRDIALRRRVTPSELDKMFKRQPKPAVHGQALEQNLETGHAFQGVNRHMSNFYGWVGKSNEVASRHPLFVALYNDEIKRRIANRLAIAKRKGNDYLTNAEIEQQAHQARLYAHRQVNRTLFSLGSETEMAHFLRLASPFFSAWQEGLDRYWRIVSNKPQVIRGFQLAFDAPRKLGIVVDENGEPVGAGEGISDQHYIRIQMPPAWGGGWDPHLQIGETSLSLMTQGGGLLNPGAGPMVQIPLNEWAIKDPENKDVQKIVKAFLPLGSRDDRMAIFESSGIRSLNTMIGSWMGHHSTQFQQYQAMRLRDLAVDWNLQHPGQAMTQTDRAKLIEESERQAKHLASLKFVTSELSPAAINPNSKYQVFLDGFRQLQDQADKEDKDQDWVLDQFIKQYGEAYFPLTEPSSHNPSGLPQTLGAVEAVKQYRGLLDKTDPAVYRLIVGDQGEGEFSGEARNYLASTQMQPGSTETFIQKSNPREAMEEAQVSRGWFDYNKLINRLNVEANAQGLPSYLESDDLVARKQKAVKVLGKGNDLWWQDYNSFNPAQYESTLESLRTIAADKKFKSDPSKPAFAIQQYLTLRDAVTKELQARAANGLPGTMEADANADLALAFKKGISRLVESNTYFSDYAYSGLIEHDPYIRAAETLTTAPAPATNNSARYSVVT